MSATRKIKVIALLQMLDFKIILIIYALLFFLPFAGLSSSPGGNQGEGHRIALKVNMICSNEDATISLCDTLSISIFETTTGDEYVMRTITGSLSIWMASDKHYFIYLSKKGHVTHLLEFQTAGLTSSHNRHFYADYDPISIEDYDGYSMNYPMSVVKFNDDAYGTVNIENIGINVLFD